MPKAVKTSANGKSISTAIIARNITLEDLGQDSLWPESARFAEEADAIKECSEAYIARLLRHVPELTLSLFSMPGDSAARNVDDFLKGGKNAWSYIGGGTPDFPMPDNAPFLVTRNLRLTDDDLRHYSKKENADDTPFVAMLDVSEKTLLKNWVVIVYRDSNVLVLVGPPIDMEDLTASQFFNDCEMPPNAYIAHPRATSSR